VDKLRVGTHDAVPVAQHPQKPEVFKWGCFESGQSMDDFFHGQVGERDKVTVPGGVPGVPATPARGPERFRSYSGRSRARMRQPDLRDENRRRRTQHPLPARPWGFKSLLWHSSSRGCGCSWGGRRCQAAPRPFVVDDNAEVGDPPRRLRKITGTTTGTDSPGLPDRFQSPSPPPRDHLHTAR